MFQSTRIFTKCCLVFGSPMMDIVPDTAFIPGIRDSRMIAATSLANSFNRVRFGNTIILPCFNPRSRMGSDCRLQFI